MNQNSSNDFLFELECRVAKARERMQYLTSRLDSTPRNLTLAQRVAYWEGAYVALQTLHTSLSHRETQDDL